jgi:hypothetical protein
VESERERSGEATRRPVERKREGGLNKKGRERNNKKERKK